MAGLLAANMLRKYDVQVFEAAPNLPNNHSALLRFRSVAVSDATGIPFKKVRVDKGFYKDGSVHNSITLADANRYSAVVTRGVSIEARSVWSLGRSERWIAPWDFIRRMADTIENITFGHTVTFSDFLDCDIAISTIAMPVAMKITGWDTPPRFGSNPVWTLKTEITSPNISVHQTLYQATYNSWYRATLHEEELTLEFAYEVEEEDWLDQVHVALTAFDIVSATPGEIRAGKIPFGKMIPINESLRRKFIYMMTQEYGVYSLGRFATWRPALLLDDLVKDIQQIERMIEGGVYESYLKHIA